MNEENLIKFKQFDGSNFPHWKFRIGVLLDEHDLKIYIEKDYSEIIDGITDARVIENHRVQEKKCKSFIIKRIADSQLEYIKEKDRAKEIFDTLVNVFERKSISSQLYLRKKLLSLKYNGVDDMMEFFLKFDGLVRELKSMGAKIEDLDIVCHLLLTMPDSYDHVVTVLESVNPNKLTIEIVKGRLLDHANKIKNLKGDKNESEESVAMNAKGNKSKNIKCWNCGKMGYYSSKCKLPTNNKSKENDSKSNSNNKPQKTANNASANDDEIAFMAHQNSTNTTVSKWYVDSGATDHMTNDDSYFYESVCLVKPINISVAKAGIALVATKIGNIHGYVYVNGQWQLRSIKNVLYVADLKNNLFSIRRIEDAGFSVVFGNGVVKIMNDTKLLCEGKRINKLYELTFEIRSDESANICVKNEMLELWHRRLGHLNKIDTLTLINNDLVNGVPHIEEKVLDLCEPCIKGKQTRKPFHAVREKRSSRPLELIHSDVNGPFKPASLDEKRFVVSFIDDYTRFSIVYLMKEKSEVIEKFKEYIAMVTTQIERKISKLKCDNGGEYTSHDFKSLCKENGICIEYTSPYTPEQNGTAERFNRTLIDKARAMIEDAQIHRRFWGEAVLTSNYLHNRSPTNSLKNNKSATPAELWFGRKPNISHLKVFGCIAYVHIPKEKRSKLDSKSNKCVMVGYATNGYRLYDPEKRKIIVSRDVVFDEKIIHENSIPEINEFSETSKDIQSNDERNVNSNPQEESSEIESVNIQEEPTIALRRSERNRRQPDRFGYTTCSIQNDDNDFYGAMNAVCMLENLPNNLEEAKQRSDWTQWKRAIEDELNSMYKNNVWTLVKLPEGMNLVDNKWVFKVKRNEKGEIIRHKARLVARGFSQVKGFDYNETYAPVARLTSLRILFAISIHEDLRLHQMDVKTAFLYGEIEEDVYMKQPQGFEKGDDVCKLNRTIYGLKQSSRKWYERFHNFIPTGEQQADILTKGLGRQQFNILKESIGILN